MATYNLLGGPADGGRIEVSGKPEYIEVMLRAPLNPTTEWPVWEITEQERALYAGLYRFNGRRYEWDGVLRLMTA